MQKKRIATILIAMLQTSICHCNSFNGIQFTTDKAQKLYDFEFVFSELILKTFAGENILLIVDPVLRLNASFSDVVDWTLTNASAPWSLIYWDEYTNIDGYIPREFIQGGFMSIVVVFVNDPYEFFDQLAKSSVWNPELLILFSLDAKLETDTIAKHNTVQRSKFIIFIKPGVLKDQFIVYNVRHTNFELTHASETDLQMVGRWDYQAFQHKFKLSRTTIDGFGGAKIDLATFCWDFPFMYPGPNNTCPGAAFDILDILARKFNFSYAWQERPADDRWGSKENGSWTGMFADLAYNKKSIIINNIELTWDREAEFDITYPYFREGFSFILKIPDPLPKWRGVLYPFTTRVWVYILIMAIVIIVLFTIAMSIMQPYKPHHIGFLQLVSSLANQGYSSEVHGGWMHVWMLPWWFVCFVLCLAYTCNLVAFLSVTVPTKRIETINELADSNIMRQSTDPSLAKIGAKLQLFHSNEELGPMLREKVAKGTHAVINGQSYHYYVRDINNVTSQTYFMQEVLYPSYLVYYLPKNTPYTELLSENQQRLVEAGIIRKLYNKHMLKEIPPDKEDDLRPLALSHLAAAFILCPC
ncbi:Ionotropic receptor 103, partial [Hyalella azteca]